MTFEGLMNLIVAIAALFIALVQFKHELEGRKAQRFKRDVVSTLSKKNRMLSETFRKKTEMVENIRNDEEFQKTFNPNNFASTVPQYIEYFKMINDNIESLEALYKALLVFESEFSLSYGFDRYIKEFGEALQYIPDEVAFVNNNLYKFLLWYNDQAHNNVDVSDPNFQKEYYSRSLAVSKSLLKLSSHISEVIRYSQEISYKFEISPDELINSIKK